MQIEASEAELALVAGNPPPDGIAISHFRTPDGRRLRAAITPSARAETRGTVVILQGRNECIEKYFETIADLSARGFMVAAFDWRGQGGSDRLLRNRKRGHVRHFANYLRDLESFVDDVLLPDCRAPFAVLAHSMGGLVALHAAPRLANIVERMVLCAPLVALPPRPPGPRVLRIAARLAGALGLGTLPVRPELVPGKLDRRRDDLLSSDPRRTARNRQLREAAPHLFLSSPSVSWLAAITGAMRKLENSDVVAKLSIPTLILSAGADRVVWTAASERLAWRMRSGSSLVIPNARHELLQEADEYRDLLLEAFETFLGARFAATEAAA